MAFFTQKKNVQDNKSEIPEMPHPPITFEEFLKAERLDEWPQRLTSEGKLDREEVNKFLWRKEDILEELKEGTPLALNMFDDFNDRINLYEEQLNAFSAYILANEELPSKFKNNLFHAPTAQYLEEAKDSDAVVLHHSRKKKGVNVNVSYADGIIASKSHRIDFVNFPGYRPNELIELPSQLEAPQLLNKITEAQKFNKGFYDIWKKVFFSEASIALLHDAFWWFFLEHFEHNSHAQDKLYTRISENYVRLFMSLHPDMRDKIFFAFPSCFTQCLYLTFRSAFPESSDRLSEEFIVDLADTVYEWVAGVKPPVNLWKRWPWHKICSAPGTAEVKSVIPVSNKGGAPDMSFNINFEKLETLPRSPPQTTAESINTGADGRQITDGGKSVKTTNTTQHRHLAGKTEEDLLDQPANEKPTHSAGSGPDFERVLFNTSGRSPLVMHYLHMRQLREKSDVGRKMRRTEMMQIPQSSETLKEIIKQSTQTMKLINARRVEMSKAMKSEHIHQQIYRRQIMHDMRKLQASLTDPVDIKMRCERVLDQAFERGLHRPSTYGSFKIQGTNQLDSLLKEDSDVIPPEDQL